MYFEFDFNRDADFFEQFLTMKFMKEKLAENKHLKKIDPQVYSASIKLWGESIIKHNLDINMTRVEHLNLISEQNSKEVLDTIGNIIFKDKHDRTDEEFKVLRDQGMVANYLQLITLSVEEDVCDNLKKEFIEYHSLHKRPKP